MTDMTDPEPQAASWCCPVCRAEGWLCPALCQRSCCAEHALAAERVLCACGHAKFMHGDTAGDSGCRSCKCWSWRPGTANPLDDLCCDGEGCPRCDPEESDHLPHTEAGEGLTEAERETLGELVRDVWVEWATEQTDPKPSWLVPWAGLSEPDREVDRRIGEACYLRGLRDRARPADEDGLRTAIEALANLAAEHLNCTGCPTPWWLTQWLADERVNRAVLRGER